VPRYEIIPHTADIGIKVHATNLPELFQNTAYGMFDIIADLDGLAKSVEQPVEVEAANREELIAAWLGELLYNFYTKQIIFFDFRIDELSDTHLKAKAFGRHIGENRNRLKTEIKAVTYHELKIEEDRGTFTATVIFDV
jgi:SHS2 domain-containing protein